MKPVYSFRFPQSSLRSWSRGVVNSVTKKVIAVCFHGRAYTGPISAHAGPATFTLEHSACIFLFRNNFSLKREVQDYLLHEPFP